MNIHNDRNNVILHCFIQWLANRNALDKWLTAVVNQKKTNEALAYVSQRAINQPDSVINRTFTWALSIEGHKYWEALYMEWQGDFCLTFAAQLRRNNDGRYYEQCRCFSHKVLAERKI